MIQIGINGFGRIGRVILRAILQKSDLQIAAINDPAIDIDYISYLIKFDSTHGKYMGSIQYTKDDIYIDDRKIKIFRENIPSQIPWHTVGVQYVVESSGMFTTLEKASGHLASCNVRHVIVTAPSVDVPMIIIGVNDGDLLPGQKVVSCASSTLYCLAPIIKILEDSFGVCEGFVTSVHAMTPALKPIDGLCLRGKHWHDHRGIHQNIIPASTAVCRALGKIMPRVKDKLAGVAFRVPIVNVSLLDLTIRLNSNTTMKEIILKIQNASKSSLKNIITISHEHAVSSDFMGETHSCVLDVDSSIQLKSNFFKLVCWYENEYSYACRVIDSIYFLERKLPKLFVTKYSKKISTEETEFHKDIFNSTSHDTGLKFKPRSGMMLFKKPLSSLHQNTAQPLTIKKNITKQNALKCCNKEKQQQCSRIKQNTLFHSSNTISAQNREEFDCEKAQERLQILKNEFSKLVKITESLLKKSYTDDISSKPEVKATEINPVPMQKAYLGNNSTVFPESCSYVEVKQDVKNTISNTISSKNNQFGNEETNKALPRKSPYFPIETVTSPISIEYKPMVCQNIKQGDSINYNKRINTNLNGTNCKDKEILLGCSEPLQITTLMQSRDIQKQTKDRNNIIRDENVPFDFIQNALVQDSTDVSNKTDGQSNTSYKNFESDASLKLQNKLVTAKCYSQIDYNNHSENKELIEKYNKMCSSNILLHNNTAPNTKCNKSPTLSIRSYSDNSNKSMLCVHRMSPERISMSSERTSKNRSPDNTSFISNIEVYKHKEDIYDKLDSISDTDSNNSFQIKERKSQVINITDLTTSLEDLARLDKICKIIEISDELSDRLFSALDSVEGIPIRKKRWSFKDLCERIKLDDFCDNLFGKSPL